MLIMIIWTSLVAHLIKESFCALANRPRLGISNWSRNPKYSVLHVMMWDPFCTSKLSYWCFSLWFPLETLDIDCRMQWWRVNISALYYFDASYSLMLMIIMMIVMVIISEWERFIYVWFTLQESIDKVKSWRYFNEPWASWDCPLLETYRLRTQWTLQQSDE
jgi:hypothetical protein